MIFQLLFQFFVSFKELNYDDEEEEEDEEGDDSVFTSDEKQNQDSGKPDAVSEQGVLSPHISTELIIFWHANKI